jgi:hypothetical protein
MLGTIYNPTILVRLEALPYPVMRELFQNIEFFSYTTATDSFTVKLCLETHRDIQQPEFLTLNSTPTPIELKNVLKFIRLMGAPGAIIKAGKHMVCIGV